MPAAALALSDDALAFDFAPAAAEARRYVGGRDSVMAYVAAIRAVPVGPQPLKRDGMDLGMFDPLADEPAMTSALRTTQNNANDVVGHVDTLHRWAMGDARLVAAEVIKPITAIRDIIAAVPSGGTLSPKADQEAISNMFLARIWTEQIAMGVSQIRNGIHRFLTQLVADHDTLAAGPTSVERVRARIQDRTTQIALQFMKPGMEWAYGIVLGAGRLQVDALDAVGRAVGAAMQGHEAMRGGLDGFAAGAESIRAKYAAASDALASADASTRSMALRKFDLNRAIRSWEQFRDFILASGF
jgi:hypothetical protein